MTKPSSAPKPSPSSKPGQDGGIITVVKKWLGGPADQDDSWIDSFLGALRGLSGGLSAAVFAPPDVSEIQRQIFFQFLELQIRDLKANRIFKPITLANKIKASIKIYKQKQAEIKAALEQAFRAQGIGTAYIDVLAQEREKTSGTFLVMLFQEQENFVATTFTTFLYRLETTAMRKVLEYILYKNMNAKAFSADQAWHELAVHWDRVAVSQLERMGALTRLWTDASGFENMMMPQPSRAVDTINHYYAELFRQIEAGAVNAFPIPRQP